MLASALAIITGGLNLGPALSLMLGIDIIDDCLDLASESQVVSVRNGPVSTVGALRCTALALPAVFSCLQQATWGAIFGASFFFVAGCGEKNKCFSGLQSVLLRFLWEAVRSLRVCSWSGLCTFGSTTS